MTTTIATITKSARTDNALASLITRQDKRSSTAAWTVAIGAAAWQDKDPEERTTAVLRTMVDTYGASLPLGKNALPLAMVAARTYVELSDADAPLPTEPMGTFTGRIGQAVGQTGIAALAQTATDWDHLVAMVKDEATAKLAARAARAARPNDGATDAPESASESASAPESPAGHPVASEVPTVGTPTAGVAAFEWSASASLLTTHRSVLVGMPSPALADMADAIASVLADREAAKASA